MRVLHIELRANRSNAIAPALQQWSASSVQGLAAALELLREQEPGTVILDIGDSPDTENPTPTNALNRILDLSGNARIVVTGNADASTIQDLLAHGAFDFIQLPDDVDSLSYAVDRALRHATYERLPVDAASRRKLAEVLPGILTSDATVRRITRRIDRLSGQESRVMVQGEPGTGRKALARCVAMGKRADPSAIAGLSAGQNQPAVHLCHPGMTSHEIEEIFGPMRTGATHSLLATGGLRRPGVVILDSVDELSTEAQAALYRRLIDPAMKRIDRTTLRVLSTATAQLGQRIADGKFRRDLYDQLAEVHLCVPPLRQRGSDAVELMDHFIGRLSNETGRPRHQLSRTSIEAIRDHDWPGNITELRNAARQAVLTGDSNPIMPSDLGLTLQSTTRLVSLRDAREQAERVAVTRALKRVNGNIARASEMLGISRPTLYDLLNKLGMR